MLSQSGCLEVLNLIHVNKNDNEHRNNCSTVPSYSGNLFLILACIHVSNLNSISSLYRYFVLIDKRSCIVSLFSL